MIFTSMNQFRRYYFPRQYMEALRRLPDDPVEAAKKTVILIMHDVRKTMRKAKRLRRESREE